MSMKRSTKRLIKALRGRHLGERAPMKEKRALRKTIAQKLRKTRRRVGSKRTRTGIIQTYKPGMP